MRLNGGSVLAPYQITRGTLPSVAMVKNSGGVLVSDIGLGSLVIGSETPGGGDNTGGGSQAGGGDDDEPGGDDH